ncbi:hypothetical protein NC652_038370 [Populus alba x Populus x berolinensis]|nr:hypothetical protein NC652_038370 [Populus alba x Populus x berolinensis]
MLDDSFQDTIYNREVSIARLGKEQRINDTHKRRGPRWCSNERRTPCTESVKEISSKSPRSGKGGKDIVGKDFSKLSNNCIQIQQYK